MAPWGPEQDPALRRLAASNARLEEAAQLLRDVQREVAEMHAETMRGWAGIHQQLAALAEHLEARGGPEEEDR